MSDNKEEVRFISPKYRELMIVEKPSIKKEVNGEVVIIPAKIVKFENGEFVTSDPATIEFLKKHENYDTIFTIGVDPTAAAEEKQKEQEDLQEKLKTLEEKNAELEAKLKAQEEEEKKLHNEKPLSYNEIVKELAKRGLNTKGNKEEVTKRLAEAIAKEQADDGEEPQY